MSTKKEKEADVLSVYEQQETIQLPKFRFTIRTKFSLS